MTARRAAYGPNEWSPGDPLYIRPTGSATGNHVRPMVALLDDADLAGSAQWPNPQPRWNLDHLDDIDRRSTDDGLDDIRRRLGIAS